MSECGECQKVLKQTKGSPCIYCAFCKNKYHKTCNRYNLIYQENDTETIVWCRNCVRNKFNERDQTLADHEKQLSSLVDKVKDLTDKMNELINQKNTSNSNQENENLPRSCESNETIENKILDALNEQKGREKRKNNLCIRGLPNSSDDKKRFIEICTSKLNVSQDEAANISTTKRIGQTYNDKPQPLIVVFNSAALRRKVLKNAPALRHYVEEKIYISPDYTKRQLEENKKLVNELRDRRSRGENVKIIRQKVVNLNSLASTSQSPSLHPSPSHE